MLLIGAMSVICVSLVLQTVGRAEITKIQTEFIHQKGETVVSLIGQRMAEVRNLVLNMAELASSLPKDHLLYHVVFPDLMDDLDESSFIAGGGVWPEPYVFDKNKERRSFFWGRDQEGKLQFYNDYNLPDSKGYHQEEWYAPARYLKPGEIYWSRSYVDPYSFEPMVTATAPYFDEAGTLAGVTTVDVKLHGLNKLLAQQAEEIQGYIFALDRNNVFISFPEGHEIKPYEIDEYGKPVGQYFSIDAIAGMQTNFLRIKDLLDQISNKIQASVERLPELKSTGEQIAAQSYQISADEAFKIAADILSRRQAETDNSSFDIQSWLGRNAPLALTQDPLLNDDAIATVHYLDESHWYLVSVSPRDLIDQVVMHTSYTMLLWLIGGIVITVMIGWFVFYNTVNKPLNVIARSLEKTSQDDPHEQIPVTGNDELGKLAQLFNERTLMLEASRKEAHQANKAKSEFLSSMSHELRTPLNSILGYSQLLEMGQKLTEEDQDYLGEISAAGTHLLSLIDEVLDLSKIETGKIEITIEPVDVRSVVVSCMAMLDAKLQEKEIQVIPCSPDCTNSVYADKLRFTQVVLNLLSNAVKYNKMGGRIELTCVEKLPGMLRVCVSDTGEGIETDRQPEIFEPFNRLGKEASSIEGTGIGLVICKKLMQMMGGDIGFESEAGKGSTFWIELPYVHDPDCMEMLEKNKGGKLQFDLDDRRAKDKLNILYVEDNPSNQRLIERLFATIPNSELQVVSMAEKAIEVLQGKRQDLILLDINLPGMDGYEFLSILKNKEEYRDIPVIGLSAKAAKSDIKRASEAGFDGYITKPIDVCKLMNQIGDLLPIENTRHQESAV